jgi:hypothetical protein
MTFERASTQIDRNVEVILRRVLQHELDPDTAIERLSPYAEVVIDTNPSYASWRVPINVEICITAEDVRRALDKYISRSWDEVSLRRWAAFVTHVGHYVAPDPPPEDEDFNDALWDVLHELTSPDVFGAITPAAVADKIQRLAKYNVS